jgi:hypothetical protein
MRKGCVSNSMQYDVSKRTLKRNETKHNEKKKLYEPLLVQKETNNCFPPAERSIVGATLHLKVYILCSIN